MREKISVAVATYNGQRYLSKQLDSILENLEKEDEVICSDDGSTDETISIIKGYQTKDKRVKFLEGPGMGIKQNIANAICACGGEIIFLADQDDVWDKQKVKKVLAQFHQSDCSLVMHDAVVMNEDCSIVLMDSFFAYRKTTTGVCRNLIKNRYMGCCMAFKKELRNVILPIPDQIPMHDQWIGVLNELYGKKSVLLPEKLLKYRRHDENVSDFSHGTWVQMLAKRLRFSSALLKRICKLSLFSHN